MSTNQSKNADLQSPGTLSRPMAGTRLVVLSYNIRHGEGVDGKIDLKRTAGVITSVSPDIVSLQEVDRKTGRSKGVDQAQALARLTGMPVVFGASMNFDGGEYGNAVLTKLPVVESTCIPLPGEPRSALCVTVQIAAGKTRKGLCAFTATHLDTSEGPRVASPALIEKRFVSDADVPAILAGDLNALPGSPAMQALEKTWTNATNREGLLTVPVHSPDSQIDYILCRPSTRWRVVETRVLDESVASDHRPILAVLLLL